MAAMDPEQAARDLAEAERRLLVGAKLAEPSRRHQVLASLLFVVFGARWDVPEGLLRWYALLLLLPCAAVMLWSTMRVQARARALRMPGWRAGVLVGLASIISYAAMIGGGYTLRSVAVPLPFTVSSVLVIVVLLSLSWGGKRWGVGYAERVRQGHW